MSFDYCFIGDKGNVTTQTEAEAEPGSIKVLIVRDSGFRHVFFHAVRRKGIERDSLTACSAICNGWITVLSYWRQTTNQPSRSF